MRKENKKKIAAIRNPKSVETSYRSDLLKIVRRLNKDVHDRIIPVLKTYEYEYVNDAYATILSDTFTELQNKYNNLDNQAKALANEFTQNANIQNRNRFYKSVEKTIGVNIQSVVANENLHDTLVAATSNNVSLIKSIPSEYFKNIESIVFTNTTQGKKASSMIKQIQKQYKVTTKRARVIARDQTSKLNSALSQQRAQNLGSEEYIWRTAGDDRVRHDHVKNNGKTFRWDTPPKTGHPGEEILCRCFAEAVLNLGVN